MWPWSTSPARARLALALQGGGAHGAFTWGVLDALLEHTAQPIVALSGTSAGAMNAVLLAHGLLDGGRDGARRALADFWQALGRTVPWQALGLLAADGQALSPVAHWWMRWTQLLGPSRANPLRLDPLRDLLVRSVDFERLAQQRRIALHIAATHANTGRLRVFGNAELSLDVVMASACLPTLQPAVLIDGEPYWDGGFAANPPVLPLLQETAPDDLLLVLLSPWRLGDTPVDAAQIRTRTMEIAFTSAHLREMQWLAAAAASGGAPWQRGGFVRRVQRVRWHVIDGADHLAALPTESKLIAHQPLLERLRDAGRQRTLDWLAHHAGRLGRRSSADLVRLFGGPQARPD
ncbi:MAG: patatin-like phospholipase family protein [Ideonella sp.]|nr:patatin-like phospholipase family protein [Ideonella sp.]MCC7456110.1 patatin-like phospholipase family protein [Nitrospira sp.]